MGRSVSYPANAQYVYYRDVSYIEDGDEWDNFIVEIINKFQDKYPSLEDSDEWIGNENNVILENSLVMVGVSEYCGVAALWVIVKDEYYALGLKFAYTIEPTIQKFANLRKQGTMSNGVGVYQRLSK